MTMLTRVFHRHRPHPWHGLAAGRDPPRYVQAYVELTPFDAVKYEIDKDSGYLRVNRPQRTSSLPPALYGFVPRTCSGDRVAALSPRVRRGDGDPLDIFVLSERAITRAEVLLSVRVVGGIRTVDGGAADEKVIAVLEGDALWGQAADVRDVPEPLVERLRHYLATYKLVPGREPEVEVAETYGAARAERVVAAAIEDYAAAYGELAARAGEGAAGR